MKTIDQVKELKKSCYLHIKLENENTEPRLSARIKNESLYRIPEVSFIVILCIL
jgi:hypothetical protein